MLSSLCQWTMMLFLRLNLNDNTHKTHRGNIRTCAWWKTLFRLNKTSLSVNWINRTPNVSPCDSSCGWMDVVTDLSDARMGWNLHCSSSPSKYTLFIILFFSSGGMKFSISMNLQKGSLLVNQGGTAPWMSFHIQLDNLKIFHSILFEKCNNKNRFRYFISMFKLTSSTL